MYGYNSLQYLFQKSCAFLVSFHIFLKSHNISGNFNSITLFI